jgi:hypothetical protein
VAKARIQTWNSIVLLAELSYWLKLPAAISADIAPFPRAKSVVFARCSIAAEFAPKRHLAGKNHAFCRPLNGAPRPILLKSPQAISANKQL